MISDLAARVQKHLPFLSSSFPPPKAPLPTFSSNPSHHRIQSFELRDIADHLSDSCEDEDFLDARSTAGLSEASFHSAMQGSLSSSSSFTTAAAAAALLHVPPPSAPVAPSPCSPRSSAPYVRTSTGPSLLSAAAADVDSNDPDPTLASLQDLDDPGFLNQPQEDLSCSSPTAAKLAHPAAAASMHAHPVMDADELPAVKKARPGFAQAQARLVISPLAAASRSPRAAALRSAAVRTPSTLKRLPSTASPAPPPLTPDLAAHITVLPDDSVALHLHPHKPQQQDPNTFVFTGMCLPAAALATAAAAATTPPPQGAARVSRDTLDDVAAAPAFPAAPPQPLSSPDSSSCASPSDAAVPLDSRAALDQAGKQALLFSTPSKTKGKLAAGAAATEALLLDEGDLLLAPRPSPAHGPARPSSTAVYSFVAQVTSAVQPSGAGAGCSPRDGALLPSPREGEQYEDLAAAMQMMVSAGAEPILFGLASGATPSPAAGAGDQGAEERTVQAVQTVEGAVRVLIPGYQLGGRANSAGGAGEADVLAPLLEVPEEEAWSGEVGLAVAARRAVQGAKEGEEEEVPGSPSEGSMLPPPPEACLSPVMSAEGSAEGTEGGRSSGEEQAEEALLQAAATAAVQQQQQQQQWGVEVAAAAAPASGPGASVAFGQSSVCRLLLTHTVDHLFVSLSLCGDSLAPLVLPGAQPVGTAPPTEPTASAAAPAAAEATTASQATSSQQVFWPAPATARAEVGANASAVAEVAAGPVGSGAGGDAVSKAAPEPGLAAESQPSMRKRKAEMLVLTEGGDAADADLAPLVKKMLGMDLSSAKDKAAAAGGEGEGKAEKQGVEVAAVGKELGGIVNTGEEKAQAREMLALTGLVQAEGAQAGVGHEGGGGGAKDQAQKKKERAGGLFERLFKPCLCASAKTREA